MFGERTEEVDYQTHSWKGPTGVFCEFLNGDNAILSGSKWKHKDAGVFKNVFHVTKWIIARQKCLQLLDYIFF